MYSVEGHKAHPIPAFTGGAPVSSWRGKYDPSLTTGDMVNNKKREYPESKSSELSTKRPNIFESTGSSFGGMSRRR